MTTPSPAFEPNASDPVIGHCTTCHQQVTEKTVLRAPDLKRQQFCSQECLDRFRVIEAERRKRPRVIRTPGSCFGNVVGAILTLVMIYFVLLMADRHLGLNWGIPNILPMIGL